MAIKAQPLVSVLTTITRLDFQSHRTKFLLALTPTAIMNSSEILPAPGASFYTPLQSLPAGTALVKQRSGKPIPKAFEPLRIRGVEFPNRIFVGLFLNVIMETVTSDELYNHSFLPCANIQRRMALLLRGI